MAFSNTPTQDTYDSKLLPAVYDLQFKPGSGSGSLYQGVTNIIPVKDGNNLYGESRYAISGKWVHSVGTAQSCRGMYVWQKTGSTVYYFVVIHDDSGNTSRVYSSTDALTWTAVNTLTNDALTPVRFTEFIDGTNTKKLIMVDGIEGYVFTSNAAGTKIVDANFPTPHVPFPVFMDGYLFLAKANTGDIYNSNLNDPATWTAGSFISAEMYPDDLQALLRAGPYVMAIGEGSCEFFYDAANATASPLARQEGAAFSFGTSFPNSIASSEDTIIFLANNNDGETSLQVVEINKYPRTHQLKCPWISLLANSLQGATTTADKVRGYFVRQKGNLYYCFTLNGTYGEGSNPTYLYNVELDFWSAAKSTNGSSWPIAFTNPETSTNAVTYVAGATAPVAGVNNVYFGTLNPASIYVNDGSADTGHQVDVFDGVGTASYDITQYVQLPPMTFDTMNRKYMYRFGVNYIPLSKSATSVSNTFNVAIYDEGMTASSVNYTITDDPTKPFPLLMQLGSFRQRAMLITGSGTFALRWNDFEVLLNKGQR